MAKNHIALLCGIPRESFDTGSWFAIMIVKIITVVKVGGVSVIKKSDQVRELVKKGDFKKALSITKGFRLGITREQNNKMALAYECMTHERFYVSLGFNIPERIQEGIDVLVGLYGEAKI